MVAMGGMGLFVACGGTAKGNGENTSGGTSGGTPTNPGSSGGGTSGSATSGGTSMGGKGVFGDIMGGGTSGGTSGGTATCTATAADDTCGRCVKDFCCDEYARCGSNQACVSLANCLGACTTAACSSSCNNSYPGGTNDINVLVSCARGICPNECGLSDGP